MTSPWPDPDPNPLPNGPGADDDPIGLRFDRADLEDTTTAVAGDGWAINGRATTGEPTGQCAERSELPSASRPPFNLRELAARHITAAQLDRTERGAA